MSKSTHSPEYKQVLKLLKKSRIKANVTQEQMAERLGATQTFVSKCERGERRLDILELREFCCAMGLPLTSFVGQLDDLLDNS